MLRLIIFCKIGGTLGKDFSVIPRFLSQAKQKPRGNRTWNLASLEGTATGLIFVRV
jgi:hypothetical protein